ncbi:MAG: hypothetical protein QXW98_04125 [Candidatus Caldarchaeum sp.]
MAVLCGVTSGISSLPATTVGVISIGDIAIECNELDIDWHNVYDGDSYIYTQLRVSGIAIVHRNVAVAAGEGNSSNIEHIMRAIMTLAGNYHSSQANNSTPSAPHRDTFLSYTRMTSAPTPSSAVMDALAFTGNTQQDVADSIGASQSRMTRSELSGTQEPSVAFIPPADFAVFFWTPETFLHLQQNKLPGAQDIFENFVCNSGIMIPGWAMYKPISLEALRLSNFMGNDTATLRIVVSVFFCNNPISPGFGGFADAWKQPAYHKWSISSSWSVGDKPRIFVSGRLRRRSMYAGPPSIFEFLPRVAPGMTLVQLATSSDEDGMGTSYQAVYELDYTTPVFFGSASLMNREIQTSMFDVADVQVMEEAESVTQGNAAINTAYEVMLQKAGVEAAAAANMAGLYANSISKAIEIMSASIDRSIEQTGIKVDLLEKALTSGAIGLATAGVRSGLAAASSAKREQIRKASAALDIYSNFAALNQSIVSRFTTHKQLDLKALENMSNTVIRSATIIVKGFPGSNLSSLQLAAYSIAKQIFLGWIAMGMPPVPKTGWVISGLFDTDIASANFRDLTSWTNEFGKAFTRKFLSSLMAAGSLGQVLSGHGFGDLFGNFLYNSLGNMIGLTKENMRLLDINPQKASLNFNPQEVDRLWQFVHQKMVEGFQNPDSFAQPRFFTYTTVNNADWVGKNWPYSPDDSLSIILALLGIRSVKTHVSVNHNVPMVSLTLSIAFNSVEYNGNVFLHSLARMYYHLLEPWTIRVGDSILVDPCIFIPYIVPITSYAAYQNAILRAAAYMPSGVGNSWPSGIFKAIASGSEVYGTFFHLIDRYFVSNPDEATKQVASVHAFRQSMGLRYYTHGGSVGSGITTPSVTYAYNRPGRWDYASNLGGGVAADMLLHLGSYAHLQQLSLGSPPPSIPTIPHEPATASEQQSPDPVFGQNIGV